MRTKTNLLFVVAAIILSAVLLLFIVGAGLFTIRYGTWHPGVEVSGSLRNSTGVVCVLALTGGVLGVGVVRRRKKNQPISFTSHYHEVSLFPSQIEYIESLDEFVQVHAMDGEVYPTRVSISQWQEWLGTPFLRIHRSFLVNRHVIRGLDGSSLLVGSTSLPVSRKHKPDVLSALEGLTHTRRTRPR